MFILVENNFTYLTLIFYLFINVSNPLEIFDMKNSCIHKIIETFNLAYSVPFHTFKFPKYKLLKKIEIYKHQPGESKLFATKLKYK